jgi:rod shape-determining protein MreC
MKHKVETKYFTLAFTITVIFFVAVFSILVNYQKNFTVVDKIIKDTFAYITYTLEKPIDLGKKEIKKLKEINHLYQKYEKLKEEYEKTDFITAKYNESLKIIEELENILELNGTLLDSEYINATIISRDLGYFYDKVIIDKGSFSGIEENDAVVTSDGLIGKVISTSYNTSDVRLLTSDDVNMKISVKIKVEDDYLYGLLTGYNQKNNTFIIEGISSNKEIPISSEVTTTGLGDTFPSGILIGYVKSITKDHFDLERTLEVTSKVKFESVSYVTVLKRGSE